MKDYIDYYFVEQDIFYGFDLLEFYYCEENKTYTIIGSPGLFTKIDLKKNPFIRIQFTEVTKFSRVFNSFKHNKIKKSYFYFNANEYTGGWMVENSTFRKVNNENFKIKLVMNSLLGKIRFNFLNFKIDIKYTNFIASPIGDNGKFYDIETNLEVDPSQPFERLK